MAMSSLSQSVPIPSLKTFLQGFAIHVRHPITHPRGKETIIPKGISVYVMGGKSQEI
jgi:hypothetical protein